MASYITLTHFISWCLNLTNPVFKRVFPSLYILPIMASMLGAPLSVVSWLTSVVSGFLVLATIVYILTKGWTVFSYMQETMLVYQMVREELGMVNMLVLCVRRMLEPTVLACYWVTLFVAQVLKINNSAPLILYTAWKLK